MEVEGNTGCEEEPNNGSEPSSEDIDDFIKTQKIDAKSKITLPFSYEYVCLTFAT